MLFASRSAHARRPMTHDPHHAASGTILHLDERRPGRGDEPEEHQHHQLAEAVVAVRLRSARVQDRRGNRRRSDEQQPRRDDDREREPGDRGDRDRNRRGSPHRCRRGEAGGGEAYRSRPDVVGAAHAVGVVVRVVHADLERDRDHQCQDGTPPEHLVARRVGRRGTHDHRRERRAQRAGTRADEPPPPADGRRGCRWRGHGVGQGRFGKRPKSGGRFSR